ncbi:MAG: polysaccharide biosynthesis/export family protein [Ectothiorhodospiraceae bacterium]|nr:polysaccharide biosynthesis/export family protein [Ectothiorhodospiraceae bacterium]
MTGRLASGPARTGSERRRVSGCAVLVGLAIAVAALPKAPAAEPPAYRLGTGDQVRVRVYDRPDLSGEFRVRAPGVLSLPIVGEIEVAGLPLAKVERAIQDRLGGEREGQMAWVSVDVLAHRPFYILGGVRSPGRYAYEPGLTVVQAIALAGGTGASDDDFLVQVETSRALEKVRTLRQSLGVAIARRARLRAEADGATEIVLPAEVGQYLDPQRLAATGTHEQGLMTERRSALEAEVASLEKSKGVFEEEIRAHRQQIGLENTQLRLVREEQDELRGVADRRLVPKTQILALERLATQIEANKRELEAFIARARQRMDEVDTNLLRLRNGRRIEILAGLKQAEDEIAVVRASLEETEAFLADARVAIPAPAPASGAASGTRPLIVRATGDGSTRIEVDALTPVEPGDVVMVPSRRSTAPFDGLLNGLPAR